MKFKISLMKTSPLPSHYSSRLCQLILLFYCIKSFQHFSRTEQLFPIKLSQGNFWSEYFREVVPGIELLSFHLQREPKKSCFFFQNLLNSSISSNYYRWKIPELFVLSDLSLRLNVVCSNCRHYRDVYSICVYQVQQTYETS